MAKQRLLTGLQSSGDLHIGNYFGALKPFVDRYEDCESMLMVADYHALTSVKDGTKMKETILNVVKDYIAIGVDPKKATIFKQSDVLQHMELGWIFDCLVTVPFLQQGHAYKDKVAKGLEANAGLFTYPMLMAADILLYDTDLVPVGEDQRQHIEYAREAAFKFNKAFCNQVETTRSVHGDNNGYSLIAGNDCFKEPKELILEGVGVVPGTDGTKMSKSYGNTIPLFDSKEEIAKAVMSIVTDSGSDIPENVYAIHKLIKTEEELAPLYEANKGKYKNLKDALAEDLDAYLAPMREKRASLTDEYVISVLKEGGEKARTQAEAKMKIVREKIGVALY